MLSPELNTEPSTQQAIDEYWLTDHMFWCQWRAGFAAALLNMSSFLSWVSRWKLRGCVSEDSFGCKQQYKWWKEIRKWVVSRLAQQLSDPIKDLGSLHPSALPSSVSWHIVSFSRMATAAPGITSSHNCMWRQKERRRVFLHLHLDQPHAWGKTFPEAYQKTSFGSHWPKTGYITARKGGKPNISACIMGRGSDGKEEREQSAKA